MLEMLAAAGGFDLDAATRADLDTLLFAEGRRVVTGRLNGVTCSQAHLPACRDGLAALAK